MVDRESKRIGVSVLFNEPKLLKLHIIRAKLDGESSFSALQRAEIAEIQPAFACVSKSVRFSALQRAEIAEM